MIKHPTNLQLLPAKILSIFFATITLWWVIASFNIHFQWMNEIGYTLTSGLGGELGMRLEEGATRRALGGTIIYKTLSLLGITSFYQVSCYLFGAVGSIFAIIVVFTQFRKLFHPLDAFLLTLIPPIGVSMYIATGGNFVRRDGILFLLAYAFVLSSRRQLQNSQSDRRITLSFQIAIIVFGVLIHELFLFYYLPCLLLIGFKSDNYSFLHKSKRNLRHSYTGTLLRLATALSAAYWASLAPANDFAKKHAAFLSSNGIDKSEGLSGTIEAIISFPSDQNLFWLLPPTHRLVALILMFLSLGFVLFLCKRSRYSVPSFLGDQREADTRLIPDIHGVLFIFFGIMPAFILANDYGRWTTGYLLASLLYVNAYSFSRPKWQKLPVFPTFLIGLMLFLEVHTCCIGPVTWFKPSLDRYSRSTNQLFTSSGIDLRIAK